MYMSVTDCHHGLNQGFLRNSKSETVYCLTVIDRHSRKSCPCFNFKPYTKDPVLTFFLGKPDFSIEL